MEEAILHCVPRFDCFEDHIKTINFVLVGEEGQDAGGLLREWFSVITREIFNPNYALFITAPGDMVTYMINKTSYINPEHLDYFKVCAKHIMFVFANY